MANWATTLYRIESKSEDLQELNDLCKTFLSKERPVMEEGASEEWEGNIILALGIDKGSSYLRGFIQECELEDGVLRIEASEAWGATDFRYLLEGHYEDMKVYYIVEEEGCEVYATNDVEGKYFSYRFAVDSCVEGEDEFEYFKTEAEALQYIAGRLNRNSISVEEIKEWNEEHELDDDYISLHEYEIVA